MKHTGPYYVISQGVIDCFIEHPVYGLIPFTASEDDVEELGRIIYNDIIENYSDSLIETIPDEEIHSNEKLLENIIVERNRLLTETDWTQLPDIPESTKLLWQPYRQELRDITTQTGFPENVVWPTPPQ